MDEDDEEAEAEAFARNLLARVTGNAAGHREAGSTAFYGRQGSGGRELGRRMSTGQNEEELRQKVGVRCGRGQRELLVGAAQRS